MTTTTTPPPPMRKLGKNGPEIPAIGFGLMGLSIAYGPAPSDEERFMVLDRAHEMGATNWDSSDLYGDNEELLGKWFRRTGKRADIFLASKFGFVKQPGTGIDSSGAYAKRACAESLRLLGVDCIDLYYVHRVNPDTPIEETMRALAELKAEGKIRYIGLSEVSSATLRRAHKVHPVDALQMEYSAVVLDIEGAKGTDLLATARSLGVAVVAYSPLGRGLLTGRFSTQASVVGDLREAYPRWADANMAANARLVAAFGALAARKGCTASQLAVAWLLKQGDDVIPIPGTKSVKYLEENWGAKDIELTDDEEREVRELVGREQVQGERYNDVAMSATYGDTVEES